MDYLTVDVVISGCSTPGALGPQPALEQGRGGKAGHKE